MPCTPNRPSASINSPAHRQLHAIHIPFPPYLRCMSSADLLVKIDSLPEDIRRQVTDFIEFLLARREKPEVPKRKRPIGLMKGQIRMSDDFDDPLDELKEYME